VGLLAATVHVNATDRFTQTVPLPPNRAVSVSMTIGHLRVQGEARNDAVIEVVRTAPSQAGLPRIPVTIEERPDEVRVLGEQAGNGMDPALTTDITMRVPHAARLQSLRVKEGRITLSALDGTVMADVRRGPIDARNLQGVVRLETGIGDVAADQMRLSPGGMLRVRAFNGHIRLTLAERPVHARVMALALNGTIQSTIPLTMRDSWGPRWGETTLGSGEPVISLDVVTGDISIKTR
jgi:hypothetical protein